MKLTARTFIPDTMLHHGIPKEIIDKRIQDDLSFSLAKAIVKHDMTRTIVKRDYELTIPNATEYQLEVYILTPEEYKEYMELKKFRQNMKKFLSDDYDHFRVEI
jgi:hypothetical protein